jgi:prolyl-tRNA synthetase
MKLSQSYFKTYREDPQDAEINSHKLLSRAGYIKKQAAGSYIYLPLGLKVLQNISDIVREEMNAAGAHELLMPHLLLEEVYENRIKVFGNSMFRLRDRNGKGMCLGPTHEEVFTELVRDTVFSYKNLPVNLYQVQTKFRDEIRPRFGLQRAKEFVMKDAYSYDKDPEGLNASFEVMRTAYNKIFTRLGLDYVMVEADNGPMGGSGSNEFMVKSNVGEDEIAVCPKCGYAANMEKAECAFEVKETSFTPSKKELVHTPNLKTIEDVAAFLNLPMSSLVKAVVYSYDNGLVIVYLRGDREVEEVKLTNHLKTNNLSLADAEQVAKANIVAGYIGPNAAFGNVKILADGEVASMDNFVMGGNVADYHYTNCNLSDLTGVEFADLRKITHGDNCPKCDGSIEIIRGIEVGHIFKLGTHYTKLLNCKYLDEQGKEQLMHMGCYGIGVSRTLSSIVEQHSDEKGIIWPENIAPYKAAIIAANAKDQTQLELAGALYDELNKMKIETILDDRKESLGVKINDAELIGVPYIIIAGREAANGLFEVKNRATKETSLKNMSELTTFFSKN